jgi:hypothetical protein
LFKRFTSEVDVRVETSGGDDDNGWGVDNDEDEDEEHDWGVDEEDDDDSFVGMDVDEADDDASGSLRIVFLSIVHLYLYQTFPNRRLVLIAVI